MQLTVQLNLLEDYYRLGGEEEEEAEEHALQLIVQLNVLEDYYKPAEEEQEELLVEQALQVMQLTVQLNLLEDYYRPAEEEEELPAVQVVVVELESDYFDADVEQVQWALQLLQPYVQLNLVADGYKSAHYILQVAQEQQKDLHYYQELQEMVQEYLANLIWEGVCDYYEVLINVDALDYPEHDYHAQIAGQQYELSVGYLEGFQA